MIKVITTEYYRSTYGSIKGKLKPVGVIRGDAIYEYVFNDKLSLYEWLNSVKFKIKGGKITKGNTLVGYYSWDN